MNAGSTENDAPLEKLSSHLQFSTPPSFSPKGIQEGTSPPSSILGASSGYTRNLASCNVPHRLSLSGEEETLLWPLKEVFAIQAGNIFYRWVARVRSWWSGVRYEEVFPIYGGPFQKDIHYEYLGSVGSGCSGAVCRKAVTIRGPKLTFFTKTSPTYNRDEILALQMGREKGIPQIVGYLGAILQGRRAVIFMEYMAGGNLEQYVETRMRSHKEPLPDETCLDFGKNIFEAVKFLHEEVGMSHNDIHEGNVLLNADHTIVKLSDFGSAGVITEPKHIYNDTWKANCLLLFMLEGKRSRLYHEKVQNDGKHEVVDLEKYFPPKVTDEMKKFLKFVFDVDQKHLPSPAEILKEKL